MLRWHLVAETPIYWFTEPSPRDSVSPLLRTRANTEPLAYWTTGSPIHWSVPS